MCPNLQIHCRSLINNCCYKKMCNFIKLYKLYLYYTYIYIKQDFCYKYAHIHGVIGFNFNRQRLEYPQQQHSDISLIPGSTTHSASVEWSMLLHRYKISCGVYKSSRVAYRLLCVCVVQIIYIEIYSHIVFAIA